MQRNWIALFLGLLLTTSPVSAQVAKYWIFLKDKGPAAVAKASLAEREAALRLSERAVQRRLKVRPPERLIDSTDVAVYPKYVEELRRLGVRPVVISRWLNAITAYLSPDQVRRVRALPFVRRVRRVLRLHPPRPLPADRVEPDRRKPTEHVFDYGNSLAQAELVHVPTLHDAGIYGKGVIVGMLDTGFKWRGHPAFQRLEVLGEYDFIFADSVTANEPGQDVIGQHSHGTSTLSVIAGFEPGTLVGPAYGAKFYLSKTEDIRSETPVEEDNWAAAIEWMEAQGIDVASSSLGYSTFDDPAQSYTYEDMNGETTVVTRAAQIAANKGVVVVNSAGNEGTSAWHYIIAPADGKDVIAVGAVNASGLRVAFSSFGPTADGRIKPDVMAMGSGVWMARADPKTPYGFGNGTSFSCPMVAGIVAQILSAHPELTVAQVIEALRMTASQAEFPDNFMGYGIVDAARAITYWGPAFSNDLDVQFPAPNRLQIEVKMIADGAVVPGSTLVHWRRAGESQFQTAEMSFVDDLTLQSEWIPFSPNGKVEVYFSVEVESQGTFTYPADAPGRVFVIGEGGDVSPPVFIPDDFTIFQNYPNPVRFEGGSGTRIIVALPEAAEVDAVVYNLLGQEVARLADKLAAERGSVELVWRGETVGGRPLAAGVYFLRVEFRTATGNKIIRHKKLTVLR